MRSSPVLPRTLLVAALVAAVSPLSAQQAPFVYAVTIGASSAAVLAANASRKRLLFHNPNDSAKVAVCPLGPSRSAGTNITAVINGAGCMTLLPYQSQEVSGSTVTGGPPQPMPSAWVGIASAGGSALTILEWE